MRTFFKSFFRCDLQGWMRNRVHRRLRSGETEDSHLVNCLPSTLTTRPCSTCKKQASPLLLKKRGTEGGGENRVRCFELIVSCSSGILPVEGSSGPFLMATCSC